MKVVYLLDSLNRGGTEVLALDLCRNAKANDLDLIFVATGGGILEDEIKATGIDFIKIRRRVPFDINLIIRLRHLLKKRNVEVIHVHQPVEAMHAYFAAFGTKTKIVFSHHGNIPDWKNSLSLRFLLNRVSRNVVCSQALLDWYRDELKFPFPANTEVVYNGVDVLRLEYSGESIKRELNISEDALLFGMIGNFYRDPRKDQLTICRALPKVFAEIENSYFIFVGKTEAGAEGSLTECRKICEGENISDRVFFAGVRSDIPKILNSLDLFVLSSLHEGLPIAVLEAMLSETPCLLSDIKPLLEVSNNGKIAEIFETQDIADFVREVTKLAKNKDYRLELAKKAKKFAAENYSIEAHLRNIKSVYESII